ncbi:mitochondrial carrier [Polychaeton citri CBS 116435]|uniref:Mitochondrial carrier n=1 Tax=Polychaeton citri CBS 116435 TaxID=1314669 RepID=A0A9P4QE59_9PEZI|nr:mitochondrial carrier [Polychaeton citri CBS 116435]
MSDRVAAPTPSNPLPTAAQPQQQVEDKSIVLPASPTTTEQQSDNVAHALAGAGGGLLSMALTYPLVTLSTRAQVEKKKGHTGTFGAAKRIVDREGVVGLYAGMESALFGVAVTNFVYYYWYEWTRAFFTRASNKPRLSTLESMAAGALAGSATVLMTNPIWVVNTRMMARKNESDEPFLPTDEKDQRKKRAPNTISTVMKILREDGPSRFFAGVLPALVLVINPILQYTIFEQLKQILERRRKVGLRDSFLLGALGKLAATSITYPYITVKSRAHVASGEGTKEGITQSLRRIVKEEGVGGLYGGEKYLQSYLLGHLTHPSLGIGPKVTQSVLTAAFLFAFKDVLYNMTVKARSKVQQGKLRA